MPVQKSKRPSAKSIPIKEFLDLELVRNNWTKADFIKISGIKRSSLYNVLSGSTKISRAMAEKLSEHLGHSHDFWMRNEVFVEGETNVVRLHTPASQAAFATPAEGNAPQLLTDAMLRAAVEGGLVTLTGYRSEHQMPASYDLTLSSRIKVLRSSGVKEVDLAGNDYILKHGDCVAFMTNETISLPSNYIARVGPTAKLASQGIVVNTGLQIDPGFSGAMKASLVNMSGRPFSLFEGQVVMSIELFFLPVPPDTAYSNESEKTDLFGDIKSIVVGMFELTERADKSVRVSLGQAKFEVILRDKGREEAASDACAVLSRKLDAAKESAPVSGFLSELASDLTPSYQEVYEALSSERFKEALLREGIENKLVDLGGFEEGSETLRSILNQAGVPLPLFFSCALSSKEEI